MPFLDVHNLSKSYGAISEGVVALHHVTFSLEAGESLAVVGPSGAGKSTLLNVLGGLDQPGSGKVFLGGKSLFDMSDAQAAAFRRSSLGFVFQFHNLLEDFSVAENVMLPLLLLGRDRFSARGEAIALLKKVGLADKQDRAPAELSGGEQQRVAIARALIHRPKLILADEPTGNLDQENGLRVFELLCTLNRDLNAALIVVTHNEVFAKKLKKRLTLSAGHVQSFH